MAITLRFTKGHATGSDFVLFVDTDSELRQDLDRAAESVQYETERPYFCHPLASRLGS
jgi:hypothetical protein